MTAELPAPQPTADAGPYWEAAREGRLVVQTCANCGTMRFFPSHLCRACGSAEHTWEQVSGKGTIYSITIVHRAPTPAFRENAPYAVALVNLAEGPRMLANIIGDGALEAKIGDAVEVCFEMRGDAKVPQFKLVGG